MKQIAQYQTESDVILIKKSLDTRTAQSKAVYFIPICSVPPVTLSLTWLPPLCPHHCLVRLVGSQIADYVQ